MIISEKIYNRILESYTVPPPEQGGILGIRDGMICEYCHDDRCRITDRAVYEPDTESLNRVLEEWNDRGIQLAGMIHSHIEGQDSLSGGDLGYIGRMFGELPDIISELYFRVIIPASKRIVPFVVGRQNNSIEIRQDEIHIIR